MNILVLSWRDPKHPMAGGAEQVMHEHMKGWIAKGHKVTLFSSMYFDSNGKKSKKSETLDGVKIVRSGHQILDVQIRAFFWYLFSKHEKFDFVVDQFHGIPFFTPLYIRLPKLAVVQEVAREVWLKNHLPVPLNFIIGWIGYLGEPFVYLIYRNTFFMTGSESAKKDLISVGIKPSKIEIVPHGVKITVPNKKIVKEKKPTILFLGAIAKDKGIEDALRTFSILSRKGKYTFWVVGKYGDHYKKELDLLLSALGIKEDVHFFGFVSEGKKFELLKRAHVLVNPSIREGWGLVNIESNAMETPVVAYKSQGLIDSVVDGKTGIICKENTPLCLANEINEIMSNKGTLKNLQKGSLSWSKEFTWVESKKRSLSLIDKIYAKKA